MSSEDTTRGQELTVEQITPEREQIENALKKLAAIAQLTLPPGSAFLMYAFNRAQLVEGDSSSFVAIGHELKISSAENLKSFKEWLIYETCTLMGDGNILYPPPNDEVDLNNTRDDNSKDPAPLHDDSIMPFGKHKGKTMENVPVNYLHWFFHECKPNNLEGVRVISYIKRNIESLREENTDLIWISNKHQ